MKILKSDQRYPYQSSRPIDLICMGRVAVDLYAEQTGSSLEQVQTFRKYLGGCAGNIAIGTARQGLKSAMFSMIGTDAMGKFVRQTLTEEGVDATLLYETDQYLTGLVLLGVQPPDRFPLIFYRENCADMQLQPHHCQQEVLKKSKALLITGTGLSTALMRETTHRMIDLASACHTAVVFDIDYRPVLWNLTARGNGESRYVASEDVSQIYQNVIPHCDLIVGTEEEILVAGGTSSLQSALKTIRQQTQAPIVVKKGSKGCSIYCHDFTAPFVGPPFPVKVHNVLGAGDAFMSGFLRGWLRQENWGVCAQYGNASGALVVSRHGCAPAMPTFEETQYFITKHKTDPQITSSSALALKHRATTLGMPGKHSLFILAFDHRQQFEQSCRESKISFKIIRQFKEKVFEGFQQAYVTIPGSECAILVDPIYGDTVLKQATNAGILTGVPIERANVFPTAWVEENRSLYQQILERPSPWFVKVLWPYHPEMDTATKNRQQQSLQDLYQVCYALDRKLMVELIMPPEYEHSGKAVADTMTEVYQNDIYPFWWKIAALPGDADWSLVSKIIDRYDSEARIVILGGAGNQPSDFAQTFTIAQGRHHVIGFAIGRSVFWPIWQDVVQGRTSIEEVPKYIKVRYLQLIQLWQQNLLKKVE